MRNIKIYGVGKKTFKTKASAVKYAKKIGAKRISITTYEQRINWK